jgi:hypothetical protein
MSSVADISTSKKQRSRRINPALEAQHQTKDSSGKLRFRTGSTGALGQFNKTVA